VVPALVVLAVAIGVLGCAEQKPELLSAELTLFRFDRDARSLQDAVGAVEQLSVAVQMSEGRVDELYLVHDDSELAWRFDRDEIESARLDNGVEPSDGAGRITHVFDGLIAPGGEKGVPSGAYRAVAYGRDGAKSERRAELRVPPPVERAALSAPRVTWRSEDAAELGVASGTAFVVIRIYDPDGGVQRSIELLPTAAALSDPEQLALLRDAERAADEAQTLVYGFFEDWDLVLVGPAFR